MGGGASKKKASKPDCDCDSGKPSAEKPAAETLSAEVLAGSPDGCEALRVAISDIEADSASASDLLLSSLTIEDAGVVKLSKVIAKSTHLQVLNLAVNRLTDVSAEALAAALPTTKLKVLSLERNSLTAVGVAAIATRLPSSLEKLELGRNVVGVAGAQALAKGVVRLHTLGLGFAQLNPEGAQALAPILSKLTVLDVSGNHIGGQGCGFLADRLQDGALETLKLESNAVGDEGAKHLSAALGRTRKLLVLSIRRNSVTDQGAKLLAQALERNSTLKHLDLFDNSITDVGANALLAGVRKGKQSGSALNKVDLDINDVSTSMVSQVTAALKGS